jgi:hypothetical protein
VTVAVAITTWAVVSAGALPSVHWHAVYLDGRGGHVVEGWRERDRRVRRVTDGILELYATRDPDVSYRYLLRDMRRGVSFRGTAADRVRAGALDDWEAWTRGVAPGGFAQVTLGDAASSPAGACRWVRTPASDICWSHRWGLPLVVRADGRVVYAVTAAETAGPIEEVSATGVLFEDDD